MDATSVADAVSGATASRSAPLLGPPDATDALDTSSTAIYGKQLAWKQHGQRKLQHAADALRSREEENCTFTPRTNRRSPQKPPPSLVLSPRSDRSCASASGSGPESPRSSPCSPRPSTVDSSSASTTAAHPTDAQESSILLHFARQERARGFAHVAQQKLASTTAKDFGKTTKPAPFALSATPSQAANKARTKPSNGAKHSNSQSRPASTRSLVDDAWETERATLVAVLDAQRRELALRARAQADAVRAAESFASATERFEERLSALESRTADELREIRRLLARQAAASDLILRSLGLALPLETAADAAAASEGGKTL